MKDHIYIIGHKNPDTDSIVASIAYAELKQAKGIDAVAARIGDINSETDYLLKKFEKEEPLYIQNAKVKLYDVAFDEPLTIHKEQTIKEAWDRLSARKSKVLYVVDQDQKLIGVVSMSDIAKVLYTENGETNRSLMSNTPVENIAKVLSGEFVHHCDTYRPNGNVFIITSHKAVYNEESYKDAIVVLSDDLQLQRRVITDGAACLILVGVDILSQSVIRLAKEYHCNIIKTKLDMFKVARGIYRCPSVELIMSRKIIAFQDQAYIDDAYHQMSKSRYRSYPVLNKHGAVVGSLARYHLLNYAKKKFILVDHNETSQSIDHLNEGEVLEIVDHHRIGDIETTYPAQFRNEIIGSTCSIIAKMFKEQEVVPKKQTAALMCCAIISDTMNFHSPTTTRQDKELAKELAQIANLDLDQMAEEMFSAVATIKGRSTSEILYNDFKEYNINGKRIAIGQINLANQEELRMIRDDMIDYMKTINEINKFDVLMMCFTSVNGEGSNLLFVGRLAELVEEAFKDDVMDDLYFVDGVVSRKKQIIPTLSKLLAES